MGHMKKSWGKTIKTILGVLVGNLVLSFAVAAFTVPNGSSYYFLHLFFYNRYQSIPFYAFSGEPVADHFGNQCGAVRSRCSISGKEVCIDNDHQFFYLSNIPVDGTVHSGNRQSDGE